MKGKVVIAAGFLIFFCCGYYLGIHNSEAENKIDTEEQASQILRQLQETSG